MTQNTASLSITHQGLLLTSSLILVLLLPKFQLNALHFYLEVFTQNVIHTTIAVCLLTCGKGCVILNSKYFKFSQAVGNSSCLQTTRASLTSQESSHTVPQVLLKQTSTRPSVWTSPSTSRTAPSRHSGQSNSSAPLIQSIILSHTQDSEMHGLPDISTWPSGHRNWFPSHIPTLYNRHKVLFANYTDIFVPPYLHTLHQHPQSVHSYVHWLHDFCSWLVGAQFRCSECRPGR